MLTKSLDMFNYAHNQDTSQNINSKKRKRLSKEYKKITIEPVITRLEKMRRYQTAITYFNINKNRYDNILALDETRVKLSGLKQNYINANHILVNMDLYTPMEYISTQAPLPTTYRDFWKMVWDQKSSVIMMVTGFKENGQVKAHRYWGVKNSKVLTYHKSETQSEKEITLTVTLTKKITLDSGILRTFDLTNGQDRRQIFHIQYNNWGDHKEPTSIDDINNLLGYMDLFAVAGSTVGLNGPPIVHCSAGVGRSGTFIACSIVKRLALQRRKAKIPNIVAQMRSCRDGMVQTDDQYAFIYHFRNQFMQ